MLVVGLRPLQCAQGKILCAQSLPAGGPDAGRGTQFESQQARQSGEFDGIVKGQDEMIEIGDGLGPVGGICRGGRGQQRHQTLAQPIARESDAAQGLPGVCGAELQGARPQPLPRPRRRRCQQHELLRTVLRPAFGGAGVMIEK